jgi:hypothetical protein
MKSPLYQTSLIKKRTRRTEEQMATLFSAVMDILDGEEGQITVRHLFYRLVGLREIEKTESAYGLLCSHLAKWRKQEKVPWDAFADSTRWHIKSPTFDGLKDALAQTVATYRRDLWSTQDYYCEVWVEKDAIASIVSGVANSFGVPTFVARGFASLSSLYSAAQTFRDAEENGKEVIIFHLGDHDPSGHAAGEAIEKALANNFDCLVEFERIAVTPEQIEEWNLPTRPVKKTDTRAAKWTGGECVELDTIPPARMRALVRNAITDLIDKHAWNQLKEIEKQERETLRKIAV